jgi:hypothetical protein
MDGERDVVGRGTQKESGRRREGQNACQECCRSHTWERESIKQKTTEVAALSKLAGAAGQSKEAMWSALPRLIRNVKAFAANFTFPDATSMPLMTLLVPTSPPL